MIYGGRKTRIPIPINTFMQNLFVYDSLKGLNNLFIKRKLKNVFIENI